MIRKRIKALDGWIFIQGYNEPKEEWDRAKIFDSNKAYLDYITLDGRTEEDYVEVVLRLANSANIESFIEYLTGSDRYDYSESLEYLIADLYDDCDTTQEEYDLVMKDLAELSERELLDKYCINRVGKYYFYIGD